MSATLISDKDYAQAICLKESAALSKIQVKFADKIMYVSNKFVNSRSYDEDGWQPWHYETTSGYTVNVSDDVSDTYVWLSSMLIKFACKYEGRNNARLNTYLQASLNSRETFQDWLKKKYGNAYSIPAPISKLSKEHQKIYIMMYWKKSAGQIAQKMNKNEIDIECIMIEIKECLSEKKLGYILDNPLSDLPEHLEAEDNTRNPEQINAANRIKDMLEDALNNALSFSDNTLLEMYWGDNSMAASQIVSFINSDGQDFFDDSILKIKKDSDLHSNIKRISEELMGWIENNRNNDFVDNNLDLKKIKILFKIYFSDFKKYVKKHNDIPLL